MFEDPQFWVAVSFLIFVIAVFKPIGKLLSSSLDSRSAKIQKELDEALRLKEEAQALLSSYQRRQKEAADEAVKIINNAQSEAKRIVVEAEQNLEENLNKKIQVAMHKISTYEHSVMQELRIKSIDIAMATVRSLVKEKLNKEISEELVAKSLKEMNKKLSQSLN